jgi:phosphomethylpyrimidine synthase
LIAAAEADLSAEALAKAEEGMAEMSKVYDETGREWYMGAGDREHD